MNAKVRIRPAVESLPAYVPGARSPQGRLAFKLSSNENPFPPLPGVLAAVADAAADLNRYPDMYATDLVLALAQRYEVEPAQVVTGNGSVAVLSHILSAVIEPGDEVVYAWRSFEAYPILVTLAGGSSVQVPLAPDAGHDLKAMAHALTPRTRVVLLCSPNNPTGPVIRRQDFEDFMERVPGHVLVVLDEAYSDFVTDPQAVNGLAHLANYPNLLTLRTFSKAYGLAGLRVGYAIGRSRIAGAIRNASTPFGVNAAAQLAATVSLTLETELMARVAAIVAERDRLTEALRQQGWTLPEAQGNFVWFPVGNQALPFAQAGLQAGVIVRPFDGDGVRVSVGEVEASQALLSFSQSWA